MHYTTMAYLPAELVFTISEMIPLRDCLSLASTCRRFRALIQPPVFNHLHFNFTEDEVVPDDPSIRVIGLKDVKRFYELILGQGFDGTVLQGIEKVTFTVSDSMYKIPLIRPPTSPSQVSKYPVNFVALSLVNNVVPKYCHNIRYAGVHVKEYKTCPRFISNTIGALQHAVSEVNVFTYGQQLAITSRQRLNATHLTLMVDDHAVVPPFVNRFTVKTLSLDCTTKNMDMDRLWVVVNKLVYLSTFRLRANCIQQDVLRMLPENVHTVELDVKRINSALWSCYQHIISLTLSEQCDRRLSEYWRYPALKRLTGPFDPSVEAVLRISALNCDAAIFLGCLESGGKAARELSTLVLTGTHIGEELLAVIKLPRLKQLFIQCSSVSLELLTQTLLSSRSLMALCAYAPSTCSTRNIYTGKVLMVTPYVNKFERWMDLQDDTTITTKFRPSWQPKEKKKRTSRILS